MTPQPFDYHKPFKTKRGLKAELLCDDLDGQYPLGVKITRENGIKFLRAYTKDGFTFVSELDLINIPERIQRTVAINFYPNPKDDSLWGSKQEADKVALDDRIACKEIHIDCEVGEGL